MEKYCIDRIIQYKNKTTVVLTDLLDGNIFYKDINSPLLKEGDIVYYDENNQLVVDKEESIRRKQEMANRLKALQEKVD